MILKPGGRLALLSNRIIPTSPSWQDFDETYAGLLDLSDRRVIDAVHDEGLTAMVEGRGFSVERCRVTEAVHYATDDWVNRVFTFSNVRDPRATSTGRTAVPAGDAHWYRGVDARKDSVAVICTPS